MSVRSHQLKIVPRNARQLVIREKSLEQSTRTVIAVVLLFQQSLDQRINSPKKVGLTTHGS